MRVKEIITEITQSKITKRQGKSARGLNIYSDGERWDGSYTSYRLGMAVASTDGTNDPDMDAKSFIGKSKSTHPYTQEEQEMLKRAYKAVGAKYVDPFHGDLRSQELDATNTVSPVAAKKKNRYGV